MNRTPEKTLRLWLRRLQIPVSAELITRQLKTHPDYPSLLSITDTLDYLGIENAAVQIEKNLLHEVTTPFLAHLKTNGGEFVIAQNRDTLEKTYPGFFDNWSGVVVMAEKNAQWQHKENDLFLKREKENLVKKNIVMATVLVVVMAAALFSYSWLIACLIIVALAGVFVSWLIISKELGIENTVATLVCGKEAGCDAVNKSAAAKLPGGIAWSDIGITWFSSLLLVLIVASFTKSIDGIPVLLSVLSAAALPVTFFSLYYQWRVVKKWCRLCLITVGLLFIQFAVLLPVLTTTALLPAIEISDVLILFTVMLSVSIAWTVIKSMFIQKNTWQDEALKGMRFKRSEAVFAALLQNARTVDTTPWKHDLQLGNPEAPVQIMVACNPYCGPCAKAHEKLDNIIEQYGNQIGLTLRFTVTTKNKEDKKTQAVQYILSHIMQATNNIEPENKAIYTKEVLNNWFNLMNYDQFIIKYPETDKINIDEILWRHEDWISKSKVDFTPTVFINGREMPSSYKIDDLPGFFNLLTEPVTQEQQIPAIESLISL